MFTKEMILEKLRNFNRSSIIIRQLEFELGQLDSHDSSSAAALPFMPSIDERNTPTYFDHIDPDAARLREALQKELARLKAEQNRLTYYTALLEKGQKTVLEKLYMEEMTVEALAEMLDVTTKSVHAWRNKGVLMLTEMYNRVARLAR